MISTYEQNTGDGHWLRQSLKILKGEMGMICQNCLEQAEDCMCAEIKKANAEHERLKNEWLEVAKGPMPEHIASMPPAKIRLAIDAAKRGVIYGPPKPPEVIDNSSLMDWDRQDDKNGNAYA